MRDWREIGARRAVRVRKFSSCTAEEVLADNAAGKGDAGLTASVKSALINNKDTKASQINVETQKGVVQLSGFVDSEATKQAAEETAQSVAGVTEVQNKTADP